MIKLQTTVAYDVKEVAEILHISEYSVRENFRKGRIRGQQVGHKWYTTEESLKEFLQGQEGRGDDRE